MLTLGFTFPISPPQVIFVGILAAGENGKNSEW